VGKSSSSFSWGSAAESFESEVGMGGSWRRISRRSRAGTALDVVEDVVPLLPDVPKREETAIFLFLPHGWFHYREVGKSLR